MVRVPTPFLTSPAAWRSALPVLPLGYWAPFEGGGVGARSSVLIASNVSSPVVPTCVGSAWYIEVSSVSASLRQLRARRSNDVSVCATSTGSGPRYERTSCDENETACVTSLP